MYDAALLSQLAALVDKYSNGDGIHATTISGLQCLKASSLSMKIPTVYTPSLCVIVQGSKQVLLEDEIYHYAPSRYLAVSVDLPVLSQVTEASEAHPYLCLKIDIDAHILGELFSQESLDPVAGSDTQRGLFVGNLDTALLDAVLRLARLLDSPQDIRMLAPMIQREIHYRLLHGAHASAIAQMAVAGSNMHRIGQAIARMKTDLAVPIRIDELADLSRMSASSFHHHFKAVTAMSPLQYHKRLRLTQARQIMLVENVDAASTAYRVGYESATQFSREYARMFGAPPGRDIRALRNELYGEMQEAGSI